MDVPCQIDNNRDLLAWFDRFRHVRLQTGAQRLGEAGTISRGQRTNEAAWSIRDAGG